MKDTLAFLAIMVGLMAFFYGWMGLAKWSDEWLIAMGTMLMFVGSWNSKHSA